ncbi:MAG: aminopeptidase P family protein [Lachnospiraceae bacterium]|nr:aminopeptidase P family protein [Lachnospiraceae bacterium]
MNETETIRQRLAALRNAMKEHGIDWYLIPSSDYHNSEYAADFFKARAYFSGFTGSTGTLLVGAYAAKLWTDGRYFVQAAAQLDGTGIDLMKIMEPGVPTLKEFLSSVMKENSVLGFDGMTLAAETGVELAQALSDRKVVFKYGQDLADAVWQDRPALPCNEAFVFEEKRAGRSFHEKLADVRAKMDEYGTGIFFLSRLDDICWLLNLRGSDIACNPVMLSHLMVTRDRVFLFIQEKAVTPQVHAYCKDNGITIMDYRKTVQNISGFIPDADVLFDRKNVSYTMFMTLRQIATGNGRRLVNRTNPTILMKACKNETELRYTRETYLKDSAVLTEFLYWLKHDAAREGATEYSAAMKLDDMRRAMDGFLDLSFDTICGYAENGAVVHYKPEAETAKTIEAKGFVLVDSGGNFLGGTTDVTRTLALGDITDEMKRHFTAVCVGMLRLMDARFPYGCTGRNLDTFARAPLWAMHLDYNHGTGHGVGYVLNVHEGPQNIRWRFAPGTTDAVLEAGMLVSDEPGIYIENSHGIRLENILEVQADEKNDFAQFLRFAPLTWVPLDRDAIDVSRMEPRDIDLLNRYHAQVREKLEPLLKNDTIKNWVEEVTRPL